MKEQEKQLQRTEPQKEKKLTYFLLFTNKGLILTRLYDDFGKSFAKILDRVGKGAKEDGNTNRSQITFHSFRRFVKTTISDLG
jgi:hypothetical protein